MYKRRDYKWIENIHKGQDNEELTYQSVEKQATKIYGLTKAKQPQLSAQHVSWLETSLRICDDVGMQEMGQAGQGGRF